MSNDPKSPATDPGGPASSDPPAAGPVPPEPSPMDPAAHDAPPKHHDDLIAEQRREIADLKDRVLRAHAEVENLRKRAEREKDDTAKYAITRFARDVLNVGDNFQRALAAVPAGAADADPALKALVDGVELTEREFLNVLERHGVKRIEANAQPFNPHLHQAVMEMARPDVAAGTIVQVFQAGYTLEERTLRPAMVVVATGGPKASKPEAEAAPATAARPAPTPPPEPAPEAKPASPSDGAGTH